MVGAVMAVTVLGASGLVYRASGQAASSAENQSHGKPKSQFGGGASSSRKLGFLADE
jgi:hypothetical protein